MSGSVLVFAIGATVLNVLIYGSIVGIYFLDQRRVDPPKPGVVPAVAPLPSVRTDAELPAVEHEERSVA